MGLREQYGAFNVALQSLYKDEIIRLAKEDKSPDFDDAVFENAANVVYENGGFDLSLIQDSAARAVIAETFRVLDTAIDSGLPHEVPATLRYALENNAFIFSGFKAFHALREVGLSMITEKGEIKPFNDFLEDVRKINATYNHNYLYAEYNHALGASQMAAKWHEFEQDGDRYNLQYRTAGDDRVREEHSLLHGTTLPPSDPFWDSYFPPNGWNCRCTTVQVRKNKYPTSDPDLAMKRGENCTDGLKRAIFRYNPGKTMDLFPPKHPYRKAPAVVKTAIDGYIPIEWTPKTIKEAEQFYRDKLGVNCSLAGFTAKNMGQVESIFRSVEEHFRCYPELKKTTKFVGTIKGRIDLLTDAFVKDWEKNHGTSAPDFVVQHLRKEARRYAGAKGCYAYSHGAFDNFNLSGIAFNTQWAGEKIEKSLASDVKGKWHPPGCGTLKAVFDHELGHEIDRLLGLRTHSEFLKIFGPEHSKGKDHVTEILSTYGNKNAAEFIAEAWSEYLNNETPRPVAAAVGMLIKKLYAEKYQASGSGTSSP